MAVVKTKAGSNGSVVLLKGGNVSCSCCATEPECCMYAAQSLTDGVFLNEDLPEELIVYASANGQLLGPTLIANNLDGTFGQLNGGEGPYIARSFAGDEWVFSYAQIDPSEPCLVRSLQEEDEPTVLSSGTGDVWVFDNFADTYTVNVYSLPVSGPPEETYTITRVSLCRWTDGGENELFYDPQAGVREDLWQFSDNGFAVLRSDGGPYNSPVGEYSEGNIVWIVS